MDVNFKTIHHGLRESISKMVKHGGRCFILSRTIVKLRIVAYVFTSKVPITQDTRMRSREFLQDKDIFSYSMFRVLTTPTVGG